VVDAAELRSVALFGSLDDDELASLASCSEVLEIPEAGVDRLADGNERFGDALRQATARD
jgi:hypothetical protein